MYRTSDGRVDKTGGLLVSLACVYSGSLVIAAVLATKIITIAGVTVPAGVLAYCFTFLCTDVTAEIYGRRMAQKMVWGGFVTLLISLVLIRLAIWRAAQTLAPDEMPTSMPKSRPSCRVVSMASSSVTSSTSSTSETSRIGGMNPSPMPCI